MYVRQCRWIMRWMRVCFRKTTDRITHTHTLTLCKRWRRCWRQSVTENAWIQTWLVFGVRFNVRPRRQRLRWWCVDVCRCLHCLHRLLGCRRPNACVNAKPELVYCPMQIPIEREGERVTWKSDDPDQRCICACIVRCLNASAVILSAWILF